MKRIIEWWRTYFYRRKVRWVVRRLRASGICACEMCLAAEMRWGIGSPSTKEQNG